MGERQNAVGVRATDIVVPAPAAEGEKMKKKKKTKKKTKFMFEEKTASYLLTPINNGYLITVRVPKRPTFLHFATSFAEAMQGIRAIETGNLNAQSH